MAPGLDDEVNLLMQPTVAPVRPKHPGRPPLNKNNVGGLKKREVPGRLKHSEDTSASHLSEAKGKNG